MYHTVHKYCRMSATTPLWMQCKRLHLIPPLGLWDRILAAVTHSPNLSGSAFCPKTSQLPTSGQFLCVFILIRGNSVHAWPAALVLVFSVIGKCNGLSQLSRCWLLVFWLGNMTCNISIPCFQPWVIIMLPISWHDVNTWGLNIPLEYLSISNPAGPPH